MLRAFCGLLCFVVAFNSCAWNATGHRLVAQIAYDNLTPETKRLCNQYNRALNKVYPTGGFVAAATWMDYIRTKDIYWYDALHYINIPFSKDNTPLIGIQPVNAVSGIKQAMAVLSSKKSSQPDKGLALRMLIHLVGDLHQPLHAAALVSRTSPQGDKGATLFVLGKNPFGNNLHHYWDIGGGAFLGKTKKRQLQTKAHLLEMQMPCNVADKHKKPEQWADESHKLAVTQAYTIRPGSVPSEKYQLNAQQVSQQRVALAGCRLAALLNRSVR